MQTYSTAAPRVGKVAPGSQRGLIAKTMTASKPQAPKYPSTQKAKR